eukprot:g3853.t1
MKVGYLPLDERFATRGMFLNLARVTEESGGWTIETPDLSLISSRHRPANLTAIDEWIDRVSERADALVISTEMYLYGGLIASRESNTTWIDIKVRADRLLEIARRRKTLRIMLSQVVQRIPSYDSDFEEPWYWATYGSKLYQYSYHTSKYRATQNASDALIAREFANEIPTTVMDNFLWRRARNDNATRYLLREGVAKGVVDTHLVTEDDSGVFGLNVDEARGLRDLIRTLQIPSTSALVYPGADEVGLVLLARLAAANGDGRACVRVVWRAPSSKNLVPNYESQPMAQTVTQQLAAAGFKECPINASVDPTFVLIVNNFETPTQFEASQQATEAPTVNYRSLDGAIRQCDRNVVSIADTRFSNGGDVNFVSWIVDSLHDVCDLAYAGWNTDGNTLGTAVASGAVYTTFGGPRKNLAARIFNLYRMLEDVAYQSVVRQRLRAYVLSVGDDGNRLESDLTFYERYVLKLMRVDATRWMRPLGLPNATTRLDRVGFPWNRTFEISLSIEAPGTARDDSSDTVLKCDVVVVGGSTAALAAALAASDDLPDTARVCLTEPTAAVGGQLTTTLLSAIDFGYFNRIEANLPTRLTELMRAVGYPKNPGGCWVSELCYRAEDLLALYIRPQIAARPNLVVLYRTVPTKVTRDDEDGSCVREIQVVQRDAAFGVGLDYSDQVESWYDASADPASRTLRLVSRGSNMVVIEASELGDVLALGNAAWSQGQDDDGTCGQDVVFPFDLAQNATAPPTDWLPIPSNNTFSFGTQTVDTVWSYRRVRDNDVSLQAWGGPSGDGNDFGGSIFLNPGDARAQVASGRWRGGLNLTALKLAETHSLEYAAWFRKQWLTAKGKDDLRLVVDDSSGIRSASGLSAVPYLRDTRRSVGIGGFRLEADDIGVTANSEVIDACTDQCDGKTVKGGVAFDDVVALGEYIYFDSHTTCPAVGLPTLAPYKVPFRALTSGDLPNVLTCGKTMAQTYGANAGTRFHPVEWTTGEAAGTAAALMIDEGVESTESLYRNASLLRSLQDAIRDRRGPLEWRTCPCDRTSRIGAGNQSDKIPASLR